jgi:PAS domain S-box-containing protein
MHPRGASAPYRTSRTLPQHIVDLLTADSRLAPLRAPVRWAIAVVTMTLAFGTVLVVEHFVDYETPLQPLYVALVVIACWAGPAPALVSLLAGALGYAAWRAEPHGLLTVVGPGPQASVLGFLLTGLVIIAICGQLRRLQRRAGRAEARLQLAQEKVGVAAWEIDLVRELVIASEHGWRQRGLPPRLGPAPLAEWRECVHPDDRARVLERLTRALESGADRYETEFRVVWPDGTVGWLASRIAVQRDRQGQPLRTSGVSVDVTESRRLRDARDASERQLRLITDALPVLIAYVDAEHRYRFVNAAYERWFGRPAASLVGRTLADVLGEETYATVRARLEQALAGGTVRCRARVSAPGVGLRDVAITYVPQVVDGRVEGVVSLVDDVTDQVAAEQRLRESEERLQLAMEGARMGTWWRDLRSDRVAWDRQHARLLGFDPERMPRPSDALWMERVHPQDRERVLRELRTAREGRRAFDLNLRILRADSGEERWLAMHGRFLPDEHGDGLASIGVVFDVTDAKRREAELRRSEALYRTLGEAVPDLVWSSTADGRADYVNRRWVDYTGLTLEQFRTLGWNTLVHPDDAAGVRERWQRAQARRSVFEAEFRCRRRDGEYRWLWCRALPSLDADGRTAKWVGIASDVTARRRTEEELRRTEAALREVDKRKDEFLATLAHELRNPLAPIRYAVRLLRPDAAPAVIAQGRDTIDRQAAHMARLLDDLLDMSRITRGAIELKRQTIDLRQAVEDSIEVARPMIEGVQHRLEVRTSPQPVPVDADGTRLAQIVGNLLQNAAKYTDPGGSIAVAVAAEDGRAVLRVQDTGIGLSAEMQARVFELFSQVHRSITSSRGGLGIGLAIVRRLVELHGGTIDVRSEGLGRGTEFVVRLPLAATVAAAAPGNVVPLFGGTRRRVLVVDDNEDAAESLATLLRLSGHSVQVAYDGAGAIALAETAHPDVVVLDLGMPRMSGFEVARWLRRQPWGAGIRLIAVTGWGQEEDRRRSREAGFDRHLTKPVDPDDLLAELGAELGAAPDHRTARSLL